MPRIKAQKRSEYLTRVAKGIGEARRLLGARGLQVAAQTVGQSENVVRLEPKR